MWGDQIYVSSQTSPAVLVDRDVPLRLDPAVRLRGLSSKSGLGALTLRMRYLKECGGVSSESPPRCLLLFLTSCKYSLCEFAITKA